MERDDPPPERPPPPSSWQRALGSALQTEVAEAPGSRIGPYKLLQELGEGGFGVVWMAEQLEPIRRRVALKIVKLGMDTREVTARFETERQALALMDHPNIARVFDAGTTAQGRPYFVMELVRGVPITRYCDDNRLPPAERLRLFIPVCRAVQHAHQKGVIHRDLKPSNILVTLHDGVPVPKVIDFGIARATNSPLTDKTLFTRFHAFLGTPVYTSPEQMEMSGLDVDTRSDIYSLGVLLYELLAGRPPFDADALARSGLDAMRRTIREVEPLRPSQRLRTLPDGDRTTVARERGTEVQALLAGLHGDLDCIIMRCLEKDRTRRYDTANGLALDVERYLHNEPVVARAPSHAYRARKFIRRHRFGVAAAGAVAASLVAGLVASSILLVRERAAHRRAAESERIESELRRQAEEARGAEEIRAGQTARDLAGQLLERGRTSEGIAWLVHAARKNPRDAAIAPRLASLLASRNFVVPEGAPLELGSRALTILYAPDGTRVFILGEDGTLAVVDTRSGHVVRDKLPSPPRSTGGTVVAGDLFALLCHDGVIRVIGLSTAQVVREIRFDKPAQVARTSRPGQTGQWEPSPLLACRPGRVLFVVLEDRSVAIVDVVTGRVSKLPWTAPATLWVASISSDGRWFVPLCEPFRELEVWDTTTGRRHRTLAFPGSLFAHQLSPDESRLVTLAPAGAARQAAILMQSWSFPDLEAVTDALPVENVVGSGVARLEFSSDGQWVLLETSEGRQVYEVASSRKVGAYVAGQLGDAFAPGDRRFVAEVTGGIQFFDTLSALPAGPLLRHGGEVSQVTFSESGDVVLTTCSDGFARLWEARTGELLVEPTLQQNPDFRVALSPDGRHLALGAADGAVYRLRLGRGPARPLELPRVRAGAMPAPFLAGEPARLLWFHRDRAVVLDAASGREVAGGFTYPEPVDGFDSGQRGFGVRPDLRVMVVRTRSGKWQSWEIETAGLARVVPIEQAPEGPAWVSFSPSGDRIALVANDALWQVRFWDLRTGKPVGSPWELPATMGTHNARPGAFSPDGRHFTAGLADGTLQVCDVARGTVVHTLPRMRDARIMLVGYSPDGSRLVVANSWGEFQLWDTATGQAASPPISPGLSVSVGFSPDGALLLTGSSDGTARVWRAADGAPLGPPVLHGTRLRSVDFDATGSRLVTVSHANSARVWDVRTRQPLTEPLMHPVRLFGATFSPDGRFLRSETVLTPQAPTTFWLWSLPPPLAPGETTPEWLLQLATVCSTKRVDGSGQCVDAPESIAQIEDVRRALAALPADAFLAEWGRWILDDRADRPIAPGFAITPAQAEELKARFGAVALP